MGESEARSEIIMQSGCFTLFYPRGQKCFWCWRWQRHHSPPRQVNLFFPCNSVQMFQFRTPDLGQACQNLISWSNYGPQDFTEAGKGKILKSFGGCKTSFRAGCVLWVNCLQSDQLLVFCFMEKASRQFLGWFCCGKSKML